jgi:hypothetical protein
MIEKTIKLDSEPGKRLGLTSEDFEYALVWDCRPKYLGVVRLKPKHTSALKNFFELGKTIYSVIVISAPTQDIIDMSKDYGYELKKDPAGTPYLTDETLKIRQRQQKQG